MSHSEAASNLTALVVEDFDYTRELISAWLRKKGFRVLEAADGAEAVEIVRHKCPDLIIMDLSLPRVDGISATLIIRELEGGGEVPIIACSAHSSREWYEQALMAGCTDFVSKPVDLDALETAIARCILEAVITSHLNSEKGKRGGEVLH